MKRYPHIDYCYRPSNYWDDQGVLPTLLRNVKGGERRAMIMAYYEAGRLEELHESLLQDVLTDEVRERLGQIHPAFMGGEYLPDYHDSEAEIARIELESTTRDVISIRAYPSTKGIRYRVVDEYGTAIEPGRKTSRQPLTLGQLVKLIDESWHPDGGFNLALCYNNAIADPGMREGLRHFTRIGSDIYTQLSFHYENVLDEWVAEEAALERAKAKEHCDEG